MKIGEKIEISEEKLREFRNINFENQKFRDSKKAEILENSGFKRSENSGNMKFGESMKSRTNLSSPFDTFPDAKVASNPSNAKGKGKGPTNISWIMKTSGDLKDLILPELSHR